MLLLSINIGKILWLRWQKERPWYNKMCLNDFYSHLISFRCFGHFARCWRSRSVYQKVDTGPCCWRPFRTLCICPPKTSSFSLTTCSSSKVIRSSQRSFWNWKLKMLARISRNETYNNLFLLAGKSFRWCRVMRVKHLMVRLGFAVLLNQNCFWKTRKLSNELLFYALDTISLNWLCLLWGLAF